MNTTITDPLAINRFFKKPKRILQLVGLFFFSITTIIELNAQCPNPVTVSGNAIAVVSNNGVVNPSNILGPPDNNAALFYDHEDQLVVELDDLVEAGNDITITWKYRDYTSSYSGPAMLAVYESEDGINFTYNTTLSTLEKIVYVDDNITVTSNTLFLKLVNTSTSNNPSPDLDVDAASYSFTSCEPSCTAFIDHIDPVDASNCNTNDGQIIIDPLMGQTTLPFNVQYTFNGQTFTAGPFNSSGDNFITGLAPGVYSNITLIDANGCTADGGTLTINCTPVGGSNTVCVQIAANSDDAEERPSGFVDLNSSDLELIQDGVDQTVGMRFINLNIPNGASINNAYIQFTTDETNNINPCNLQIFGEDSDDAPTFVNINGNISNRPKTSASMNWSPSDWLTTGEAGPNQKTVDIAPIIQEIVNRNGYTANSSIVIIIEGTGKRVAESYNGVANAAPELCVTFGCDDSDEDGTCDQNDVCTNGPEPGTPCDDGDPNTVNDVINSNCICIGTSYDCPALQANFGDACDDGVPSTINDQIDSNCQCVGTPVTGGLTVCSRVAAGIDDAEEKSGSMSLTSTDLELIQDNVNQKVGMRFVNLNIPNGASINSAFIQFTTDETNNINPCVLQIFGQDSDDAATFADVNNNISNRPKTSASVNWSPSNWLIIGESGPAQQTVDIAPIIQEIVNRNGYTANSSIVIIIEGSGKRVAESYNGTPNAAPELCVTFGCDDSDGDGTCDQNDVCTNGPEPGTPCDDGDPNTVNDVINSNCICIGTSYDCPALQANFGDACDDGVPSTINDQIDSNCQCVGTPVTGGLTVCSRVAAGSDDGEERPSGSISLTSTDLELIQDNINQKVGMRFINLNIPKGASINNAFIQFTTDETNNINPCVLQIFGEDSDDASTFVDVNNNISNRPKTSASVNWSPSNWLTVGEAGAAQQTVDIAPIIQEIVNRTGYTANSSIVIIIEGSGKRVAESYNGTPNAAPELCVTFNCDDSDGDGTCDENDLCENGPEPGTACDDNDPTTTNDQINSNCQCVGIQLPNQAPDAPTNPSPADNATDVSTSPDLCVNVNDPDGDQLLVRYFGRASSGGTPPGGGSGSALRYSGDDYVILGNDPSLQLTDFTLEAWIKIEGPGTQTSTGSGGSNDVVPIITKGRAEAENAAVDVNYFLGYHITTKKLIADFEDQNSVNRLIVGNAALDNEWNHVAATYDVSSQTWTLYINGAIDNTLTYTGNVIPQSLSEVKATIGTSFNSLDIPDGFFDGIIDEVRIWNIAQSASQVAQNYQLELESGTGLAGRWGFNENSGTLAQNSITSGPDGQIVGTTEWTDGFPSGGGGGGPGPSPNNGEKFTLIWIPDTQKYVEDDPDEGSPEMFYSQTDWIVANRASKNIVYVGHLGDCVQHGDDVEEWDVVETAMYVLEDPVNTGLAQGIPYGLCVGNHDQIPVGDPNGSTALYNSIFGVNHFSPMNYYGGHYGSNNDNHYELFSASGIDFLIISLEFDETSGFGASGNALDWGEALIANNPDRRVIVMSHSVLQDDEGFSTQGEQIYDRYKVYPNLMMLVGGHHIGSDGEARRTDDYQGNTVHSILSNYQGRNNGGDGRLRIFEFDPPNNQISVQTFSPYTNSFETDNSSEFVLDVDLSSTGSNDFTLIGENFNVPSGTTSCINWPGLLPDNNYEWYVEVIDANYTTTGPIWDFTTISNQPTQGLSIPLYLSAKKDQENVLLNWKTLTEYNNLGFELESSFTSQDWQHFAWLDGKGVSFEGQEYNFNDTRSLSGNVYYRLKQIDLNGEYRFSNVATVKFSGIRIFPNPATRELTIAGHELEDIQLATFYNQYGEKMWSGKLISNTMDVSFLPPGMYVLELELSHRKLREKFVIVAE